MKKYISRMLITMFICFSFSKIYALSDEFLFTIETVGIPRYNSYGKEISEDVYIAYNIFAYSEPHKITSDNQRWKNSKYGYWAKNKGRYTGSGTRGEYYVIGYTYSGEEIFNYYFPMDAIPTTTPDTWTFYSYPIAESSWKDTNMYKYEEQLTHMLKSKLMFNDVSSTAKANNPKYIKEYDITAEEIGKKKARLETAATWRTYGMISTRRKISGVIYKQVYLVKPMAADADVEVTLNVPSENVLTEDQDELLIPITYSVNVVNMSGYANQKHIKEIKSIVYIDGNKVDEISGSKITSVGNEYMLVITRELIPPNTTRTIKISIDGYMHTEFAVDGLMRKNVSKTISVTVKPKNIDPVKNMNIAVLEKQQNTLVVRPLARNIETNRYESEGFIEAGKILVVKLNLAVDNVEKLSVKLDEKSITHDVIMSTPDILIIKVKIPEETETTLYGETSLREEQGSYFNVSRNEMGTRKKAPYILKIVTEYNGKEYVKETKVDVLDTFITNMNSEIYISNSEEVNEKTNLSFWLDS